MSLEQKILAQSLNEYDAALKYRAARVKASWHPNEDLYYGRKSKKLKGRHNVMLGDMQGFIDTWLSKIDDPPFLRFTPQNEADLNKSKRVQSMWERDSDTNHDDWKYKDLLGKKSAGIYGRAIYKYFAESDPEYRANLIQIDPYDFLIDPGAGGEDVENAMYMGHDNIFKHIETLKKDNRYNQNQVALALMANSERELDIDNEQREKSNRLDIQGLASRDNRLASETILKLCEWYTTYQGRRYLIAWDRNTNNWLRLQELREVFETPEYNNGDPMWCIDSWATNPDSFEFWSPSPADQVREIFIAKSILINQSLDNRQYRNFGMKIYDTKVIKNPALLNPRWAGLVPATPDNGKSIRDAFAEISYPSVGDTQILLDTLEGTASKNSGITPTLQGFAEEDKAVGVFEGEVAQAADRLGLLNKSYSRFWVRMAVKYINGLKEHLNGKIAVKILGKKGIKWEEILKSDLDTEFDVVLSGGNSELLADARKARIKFDFLASKIGNTLYNQKKVEEIQAEIAGFEQEEIKILLDPQAEGDEEILAEAAEENLTMLNGEDVEANDGATSGHVEKHLDFLKDEQLVPREGDKDFDKKSEIFDRIMAHVEAEMPIAMKNAASDYQQKLAEKGLLNEETLRSAEQSLGAVQPQGQQGQLKPQLPGVAPSGVPEPNLALA